MRFDRFDARHYETLPVPEGYRLWSASYDATVMDELDLSLLERLRSVAWSELREAADLACGTGRIGAWLRARGCGAVDGVDLTPEMLEHAARRGVYRRLALGEMTAAPLEAGRYGLVVSSLAVEHLPGLAPFYREAARLCTPDGALVLVGYHPFFLLSGIPTHFDPEPGRSVAIENHVHLFADHVRAAHEAGWQLEELDELLVDEAWVARLPRWQKYLYRPVSFVLAWSRRDRAAALPAPGRARASS